MFADRIADAVRFAIEMRRFLGDRIDIARAARLIGEFRARREERFVELFRDRIFERPDSPYLALLRHSGITLADVTALMAREGIEGTLQVLAGEGVWLTLDEFQGRRSVRRGSLEINVAPGMVDNRESQTGLELRTGATRSQGMSVHVNFALIKEETVGHLLHMISLGSGDGPVVVWFPILPGSAGIKHVLRYAQAGWPPLQWRTHVPARLLSLDRARWMTAAITVLGRAAGSRLPWPRYLPISNASEMARWVARMCEREGTCLVDTYVSSAVRICHAATSAGIGLQGALFLVSGEPLTPARAQVIAESGARASPQYALSEAGMVAVGCATPDVADDMHLLDDRFGLILRRQAIDGDVVDKFLLTTLSPYSPKIMLNVETGDAGVVEQRSCGCLFGKFGHLQHLHSVWSYEKFTAEGMTVPASFLVRIVEEVLPRRFGGAATDYQFVEDLDDHTLRGLRLIASPRLGVLDESRLVETVLHELEKKSRIGRQVWEQARVLQVERREPVETVRGKLFPVVSRSVHLSDRHEVMPSKRG